MSQKFIKLEDAATRLGVSKDRLNQLREGGTLRAYRDGDSWKFRSEDVERLEQEGVPESSGSLGSMSLSDDGLSLSSSQPGSQKLQDASTGEDSEDIGLGVEPLGDGDDAESILLTGDQEPGRGLPRPQSTIIGKSQLSLDDDLKIASDSDLGSTGASKIPSLDFPSGASASFENLPGAASASFEDIDELELDLEEESGSLLDSSRAAKSASADSIGMGNSASMDVSLDELEIDLEADSRSGSGSGERAGGARSASAESIAGAYSASADMKLDELDDIDLDLDGSDTDVSSSDVLTGQESRIRDSMSLSGAGSVAGLSGIDSVQISADEDDDLVLGGSEELAKPGSGSGSDSGIDLSPSDSGFALDEVPLDLGGSAMGSALDLASLSAVSGIGLPRPALSSVASGSVSAGDFQLTPAESGDEEDSSQIVALEDVGEDDDRASFDADDAAGFAAAGTGMEPVGAPVAYAAAAETPFPGWVIGLLGAGFFSMMLAGVMAMDLLQSMWAWDEPYGVTSSVMEGLLSLIGN